MTEEATKRAGADAAGGGGNADQLFNQGVIFWNAGKIEEAKVEFAKAVQLDPTMANAHYQLGMAIYSLASGGKGKLIEAKAPFEEYLKLAPTGEFAEVAKALLATIK
jgi:TolA-binding protein